MFLIKEELTAEGENDIDFNEGPYNIVLEQEGSYSSSESQVDNNEKPGKK